jgi:hypothetical protein
MFYLPLASIELSSSTLSSASTAGGRDASNPILVSALRQLLNLASTMNTKNPLTSSIEAQVAQAYNKYPQPEFNPAPAEQRPNKRRRKEEGQTDATNAEGRAKLTNTRSTATDSRGHVHPVKQEEEDSDDEIVLLDRANVNTSAFRRRAEKESEFLQKQSIVISGPSATSSPTRRVSGSSISRTPTEGKGKGRENVDPSSSPVPRRTTDGVGLGVRPLNSEGRNGLGKRTLSDFMEDQERTRARKRAVGETRSLSSIPQASAARLPLPQSDPLGPTQSSVHAAQLPPLLGIMNPFITGQPQSSPTRRSSYYRTFSEKALDPQYMAKHQASSPGVQPGIMPPPTVLPKKVCVFHGIV